MKRSGQILNLIIDRRRAIVVVLHLALIALSNYLAFLLRFDGHVPPPQAPLFLEMLPWLVAVRTVTFIPFKLYEGLWRYTGLWDLKNIILGVLTSTALFYLLVHYAFHIPSYSRSIFIVDSILLVCFMTGVRLTRRVYRELWRAEGERRVLVYGAGDAGEMIVRDMKSSGQHRYEPVGFIDDNPGKVGERIHGVPVLGTRGDLARVLSECQPHEIVIAIPRADAATRRGILKALEPSKIKITTLPNVADILDGTVSVSHIRTLSVEDLLARPAVNLDRALVRHFVEGRAVMVTGAGGSIGSELCRQIAELQPRVLLLYERHENSLFAIANDLSDHFRGTQAIPIIGDVCDVARLNAVLTQHRPDVIFHAAAHKHVPLMEANASEAVKNNVMATRILVEAAERHAVGRFILISTDKAVNPSSVMGATKRIAELLVQSRPLESPTSFSTVRFGNVLGSNGSVVPRFLEQIRAGGPVTVTHPAIQRYFMLIPEAVQLVLFAAAAGSRGETYVLEMGEQVKVVDLARNLIRLSGFIPDEDIQITFVGLRPGEKLSEELVGDNETVLSSGMPNVSRVQARSGITVATLHREVSQLERLALEGRDGEVLAQLSVVIPEYRCEATTSPPR